MLHINILLWEIRNITCQDSVTAHYISVLLTDDCQHVLEGNQWNPGGKKSYLQSSVWMSSFWSRVTVLAWRHIITSSDTESRKHIFRFRQKIRRFMGLLRRGNKFQMKNNGQGVYSDVPGLRAEALIAAVIRSNSSKCSGRSRRYTAKTVENRLCPCKSLVRK